MSARIGIRIVKALLGVLVIVAMPILGFGDVPQQINYQGFIIDDAGSPLQGEQLIIFAIYDHPDAGTQVWSEEQTVDIQNGLFNVQLGAVVSLAVPDFATDQLYLEVQIFASGSGWEVLTPRQPITSTPFAMKAGKADAVIDGSVTSVMIADDAITSAKIVNNSLTAVDLAINSVTASEIAKGAVESNEILDGAVTAADLADDYVNATGDTMSGDLTISADSTSSSDYVATVESSGGTYALAIQGIASSGSSSARGLSLDVDAPNSWAYGAHIDVDSASAARGIYMEATSTDSSTYGADIRSTVTGTSTGAAYGIRNYTYQHNSGTLYGIRSESDHSGASGAGYAHYAEVNGSDSGEATGIYARAHKDTSFTTSAAYGGHFIGDNDSLGYSYGVLAEATGSEGDSYGVYARAVETGNQQFNHGMHAEVASDYRSVYGLSTDVNFSSTHGSYSATGGNFFVEAGTESAGNIYGLNTSVSHGGSSGLVYGLAAYTWGSHTGDVKGIYTKATKSPGDSGGMAYGGHFVGDNRRADSPSYGVFGEATGIDGPRYGVYGQTTTSGDNENNFAFYAKASTSDDLVIGYYSEVDHLENDAGFSYGAYHNMGTDTASEGEVCGVMADVYHSGPSGTTFGFKSTVSPSDTGNAYGIWVFMDEGLTSGDAYAGKFIGDVEVTGTLSKGGGSFKIDHPLDPENRYLQHSFVESPDMKNVYDGVVHLNNSGEAEVILPDYFEALNRDFRYQLTPIGAPGPNLYIAEKIIRNRFKIAGGDPRMEVSWMVTGIRKDAWAQINRIQVEMDKDETDRGSYLYPDVFGEDATHSVEFARDPELMEKHIEAEQRHLRGTQE